MNKKKVESKHKGEREDYHKKNSKSDNSKNLKKVKSTEEIHKPKSKGIIHESKRQENSPRYKSPVKERERDRERNYDKYSDRHQKHFNESKYYKEKQDKKSDKSITKSSSKKRNQSPVKELKKPNFKPKNLTCISSISDSEESCYTPPHKDTKVISSKLDQSKFNEKKNVKSTKYTFSLREDSEDHLVVNKTNGRTDDLNVEPQNSSGFQPKKSDIQKSNNYTDEIFLDSSSSEEAGLDGDIDLNIIKEITTEKIKKVFELHEKQEQALLHLKKKLMEKKRKVKTSSSSSESSDEEPIKKKNVKRRHIRDSSSSNRFVKYLLVD